MVTYMQIIMELHKQVMRHIHVQVTLKSHASYAEDGLKYHSYLHTLHANVIFKLLTKLMRYIIPGISCIEYYIHVVACIRNHTIDRGD